MPEIKNRFEFEPNSDARKTWLGTRKAPFPVGNFSLPGFYHTIDYEKDSNWVMGAAAIEAVAIALTLYGGISKGGIYLLGAITAVILFVVFDIVGANFFHRNNADKCALENKILITDDIGAKGGLRDDLKKTGRGFKIAGVLMIVFSSILKIFSILLLGKFNIIFYIILALLYIIVIYIHIVHTGYYLAERATEKIFNKQHKKWAKDKMDVNDGKMETVQYTIRAPQPVSIFKAEIELNIDKSFKVGEHCINYKDKEIIGGKTFFIYEIKTNGILIDDDIRSFLSGQTAVQSGIIAIACLKHQIQYIHP